MRETFKYPVPKKRCEVEVADISNIAWFRELKKEDIPIAGGKGANLGEMYNLKLPIPPGFAVTAQAYKNSWIGLRLAIRSIQFYII